MCFAILLFFFQDLNGQLNYKKYYKDQIPEGSKITVAGANWTREKRPDGRLVFTTYYPSTKQKTEQIYIKSKKEKVLHGPYSKWYDNGDPYIKGKVENNQRVGVWKEYQPSGNVSQGRYVDNRKSGLWESFRPDSSLLSQQTYNEGLKDGKYIHFDSLGNIKLEQTYVMGELIDSLTKRNGKILSTDERVIEEMPRFPGCEDINAPAIELHECSKTKFLEYIYSKLKYPRYAREHDIEGDALVQFIVQKDGTVSDLIIHRGVCKEIKQEIEKIMTSMPLWRPGYQDGEAVKVLYTMPIKFRLN